MKPEKEINYNLAYSRSPKRVQKFYDQVFDQEIEKVKVKHEQPKNPDGSPRRLRRGEQSPIKVSQKITNRLVSIQS